MTITTTFSELNLHPNVLTALAELGYEAPTPIQAQSIPVLLTGSDLIAQAQTGTGKTAAFALPLLTQIEVSLAEPQALIITPTRELAIQVAEALQSYAKYFKGFQVTPIYGGQNYQTQLRALKRGVHVIVGTPGRLMDLMRKERVALDNINTVVLDEADEMLKMGFIDDIEWILEQIPHEHQTALFSATMPAPIKKIADRYLTNAEQIHIKPSHDSVDNIEQCYFLVANNQKLELLTRVLEIEDISAAIIFARTKNSSDELAQKLQARGYAAAALNGDMNQAAREKVIAKIKQGSLDIIVATDVAARGIDVERITHVINFDIPYDTESYIHRIGRTGRAGRQGKALLFVTPRERHLLKNIERTIKKSIKLIEPPSLQQMAEKRSAQLAEKIVNIIQKSKKLGPYRSMIDSIMTEHDCEAIDIATALVYMSQQVNPIPAYELDVIEAEPTRSRKFSKSGRSRNKQTADGANKPFRSKRFGSKEQGHFSKSNAKSNSGKKQGDKKIVRAKRKHRDV
ncbi:MAG: hypothetical protein Tsb005_01630 [Gammaproteobacteria bacterium]